MINLDFARKEEIFYTTISYHYYLTFYLGGEKEVNSFLDYICQN